MKRSISIFLAISLIASNVFILATAPATEASVERVDFSHREFVPGYRSQLADDIKAGKKKTLSETLIHKGDEVSKERFVVFVDKDAYQAQAEALGRVGVVSSDQNVYGEVMAIPVYFKDLSDAMIQENLDQIIARDEVVAVTEVMQRELFDGEDPYWDNNAYDSERQWYLSQPGGGNYGIDLARAWDVLIPESLPFGGSSDITIAVIDSGMAYGNIDKYPDAPWSFKMSEDLPGYTTDANAVASNLHVNDSDNPADLVDNDMNGPLAPFFWSPVEYCLDSTTSGTLGECDYPEEVRKGYIDDVNGLSIFDMEWFWLPFYRVNEAGTAFTQHDVLEADNCTNAPYTDYKCVRDSADGWDDDGTIRYGKTCNENGHDDQYYYGCHESDMGRPLDMIGHGTFVSNIIGSEVGNSSYGVGIAHEVTLLPIQIFSQYWFEGEGEYPAGWYQGGGSSDQLVAAVNYAVEQGADIINMSLGGEAASVYEELAMDNAYYNHDILLVAASGNSGHEGNPTMYPAAYESVMAVGATNMNATRSSYSSYGSHLDLSAPVGNALWNMSYPCAFDANGCLYDDPKTPGTQFESFEMNAMAGTSFAAPQVSAVAALVKTRYPHLTPQEIRYILDWSSSKINGKRFDNSRGFGVLNAYNAVRAVDDMGNDLLMQNTIIQAVKGRDSGIYTRTSTTHGLFWNDWTRKGRTMGEVTMLQDEGYLHQSVRGMDNGVYIRTSTDQGESWGSGWSRKGSTMGDVTMLYVPAEGSDPSRIIQAVQGMDYGIYTRYSTNHGVSWSNWQRKGRTKGNVTMIYDPHNKTIVQAVRGMDDGIYLRTNDSRGDLDGWGEWMRSGRTTHDVTLVYADVGTERVLVEAVRGMNSGIYTRKSTNGGTSWSNWERKGSTKGEVSMIFDDQATRLIQSVRGNNDGVYIRYSDNLGVNWSDWVRKGSTMSDVTLMYDAGVNRVFQAVMGMDYGIYTRYNDQHAAGDWSEWMKNGSTVDDITMIDYRNDVSAP